MGRRIGLISAKEAFGYNEGDFDNADKIDHLLEDIQIERGARSENMAALAFAQLKENGEILDFEDATGTYADYCESTDFWVTLLSGHRRRVQVKSSAATIRRHSSEKRYKDISFLVVKVGENVEDVIAKIREHILQRTR